MNDWCKVVLHSFRYHEVATQLLLKIVISANKALCVEAGFCQIKSHMVCIIGTLYELMLHMKLTITSAQKFFGIFN